jgi:hypothetical protein
MRALLTRIVCLGLVAGCGGDSGDDNEPEPAYPAAAGSYTVSGGFDGLTPAQANFTGTVALTQASRDAAPLGGSANITATISGNVFPINGPVSGASITTAGVLTLVLDGGGGAAWNFTGTLAGTNASGRHTLTDGFASYSGNWSMARAAATVQSQPAAPQAAPASLHNLLRALR